MTPEQLADIKKRYPSITREELMLLSVEEWNKMSITFLERIIKDYKDMLQDVFKTGKDWQCSAEDLEWYKGLLRDEKNNLESMHKERVEEQKYLRDGLNPPGCYQRLKNKI
ncbi:MAG: hypothetical protein AABY15_02055 [Nanoarchaeota archaeon]